jgi:hypothetical protein
VTELNRSNSGKRSKRLRVQRGCLPVSLRYKNHHCEVLEEPAMPPPSCKYSFGRVWHKERGCGDTHVAPGEPSTPGAGGAKGTLARARGGPAVLARHGLARRKCGACACVVVISYVTLPCRRGGRPRAGYGHGSVTGQCPPAAARSRGMCGSCRRAVHGGPRRGPPLGYRGHVRVALRDARRICARLCGKPDAPGTRSCCGTARADEVRLYQRPHAAVRHVPELAGQLPPKPAGSWPFTRAQPRQAVAV